MHIRQATSQDLPEIVSVLKASLGEADLPLSREIWDFKHVNNPFGPSLIFIAEEEGRIAGVRAFMKWEWCIGFKKYSAFRAVDTATHPEFQGRGIFKKLTLNAVETAVENGDGFVFNTPNEKSKPGYLKMGWIETGKIKVAIKPALNSFWKFNSSPANYQISKTSSGAVDTLYNEWNVDLKKQGKIFTPKSAKYLFWRYESNPLQHYQVFSNSSFYLAGYVKNRGKIKELRIAECIFKQNKKTEREIKQKINEWSKKFGVQVVSYSPNLFLNLPFSIVGSFGPVLTLRRLDLDEEEYEFLRTIENWRYSLGDLELF
ncbi:GNAT family N-acetyltransferase [Antarcticibacterium sp. 1MA-6-2]|uniref:GNAT family N-acetyltransferase n=1 Tax=Antarcticibacterium sp. 1MA-6-2 TaxID=2908210 RepID=UPI001F18A061|nr:GNAT family N-acetyltransferase [Antarcticibacterium sp. 1MA-6-2]UJH91322.1 GNAT family N-acetyltransferase [Antarcticibacterium sp. 1MA-6-2]